MAKIGWIDSHAHLVDDALYDHMDELVEELYAHNVIKVLSIAMTIEEAHTNFDLQLKYDNIDIALGFHPSDAHIIEDHEFEALVALAADPRIVGIGEIGLDYHWQKDTAEIQKEYFIKQIELANTLNKPIIVHNRDATQDVYDILKAHPPKAGGIMHCYSGSVEMAHEFVKLGMLISLAGPLTFKNARVPKEVAQAIDLEHLLIETDSPYLTPVPYRGKLNQPAYVSYVGKEMARLKEVSQVKLMEQLMLNYERLFYKK